MGYNPSTGKITAPVSIRDIQQAIGNSSGDLATLCKANTINMWAKYKPVQLANKPDTTDQWNFNVTPQRWKTQSELGTGVRPWWKGLSTQMAGITAPGSVPGIPGFLNSNNAGLAQCLAAYDGSLNGWVYNKPDGNAGGAIHHYRETDFAMYNHRAPVPLENFYVPDRIATGGRFTASALMSLPDTNGDYISIIDFANENFFAHFYFGAAVVDANGNVMCRATGLEDGMAGVTLKVSNLQANTSYKVYPFFCNEVLAVNTSASQNARFLPCPNVNYMSTYVLDRNYFADISVAAKWDQATVQPDMSITVTIINGMSTAYQHSYIYIMPMTYWNNPGPNVGHCIASYVDFELQDNRTFNYTFLHLTFGSYFIWCTFANGSYTRKTNILEPYAPQT